MQRSTYEDILRFINIPISAVPHFGYIASRFNVTCDTIKSIYSQEVHNKIKKRHPNLIGGQAQKYAERYLAGEDLLGLCYEEDLPPCTVVRRIMDHLPLGSLPSKKASEIFRQPSLIHGMADNTRRFLEVNNPYSIDAAAAFIERLERDIQLCVECDAVAGPSSDEARKVAGRRYEELLYKCLKDAGIHYSSEEALRSKGYHKTPDALLAVPIAVKGKLVTWIDSKATFGDLRSHRLQSKEQYEMYINRFGPGLVIYWHGYVSDVCSDSNKSSCIVVMDRFPEGREIVQLPTLPIN